MNKVRAKFEQLFNVRPSEMQALLWSWLYIFVLFLAYYVLRPIREELGLHSGIKNLPWLFTGTLVAMLVVNPLFSYAVKRWSRVKFISITYRFFMAHLLIFALLFKMATPLQYIWVGRAFFIWLSVFNLFIVSVFWSFIVDVFRDEQGKRLFGLLSAGASLGGIAGSALTSTFVETLGNSWLLLASIVLLEVAVMASKKLSQHSEVFLMPFQKIESQKVIGGGVFSGLTRTLRSPYMIGISFFILFYAFTSTVLYFQQATIAEANFHDRLSRTAFFANIDLWVNMLTLVCQFFVTGRLIDKMGIKLTLSLLPVFSLLGFALLVFSPTLGVFVFVQVLRRVTNFSFSKPAREVLFTVVSREDRYKTKNFIDTVVYRGGDQVGSWAYAGFIAIGLSMVSISTAAIPISAGWLAVSLWLGMKQEGKKAQDFFK